MGDAAVALARAVGYRGAGTVEFVLAADGAFYFLEMNTRLQVEHPVTELVTGLDLLGLQLTEAMGDPLPAAAHHAAPRGCAIECRLYAEDPANDFLPSAGRILLLREPQGPGIRLDSGIETGSDVGIHYDPILAKLVVYGETRRHAIARMRRALDETAILGVHTNLPLLRAVLAHPAFLRGETTTDFLQRHFSNGTSSRTAPAPEVFALAALASAPAHVTASDGSSAAPPTGAWPLLEGFRLGDGGSGARAEMSGRPGARP
jgi:acetyl/propionyl-CoA carboxylase alpha subunit